MRNVGTLALVVGLLASGCAATGARTWLEADEFRGRSVVTAAAHVPIEVRGDPVGSAEIGSSGVFRTTLGSRNRPVLHVRLTIRNRDAAPFQVPVRELSLASDGRAPIAPLAVFHADGLVDHAAIIAADTTEDVDLVYEVPGGDADRLERFALRWSLHAQGQVLRQETVFLTAPQRTPGTLASYQATAEE